MERLIRLIDANYRVVTIVSLLLTVVATFIVATRWNIDSDFKALLPEDSSAAQAMTEVGDRVGSGSALFVVVDSPDQQANIEFAGRYAEALRELDEVALAHYHNDKAFFDQHALLYIEQEDLAELRERLATSIKEAKKRANPLFVSLDDDPKPVELKTDDIEAKYEGDLAQDKYKEYLVSDDGYSLTIIVRFVESSTNLLATNLLLDRVREVGDQLDPTSFHPDMEIELGGGLVNRKREYDSLLSDVQLSAVFTVIALFAVIAFYFRRFRAVVLVLGPLAMSVLWTLAIALVIFNALTTITAFIFAILLGLGIDFSIHLLSSYDNDRARGMNRLDALIETYQSTGSATLIGASTTFGVFVVLSFAQFRGLSQFGVVASIGVVAAALAMVVTLPALIATFDRWAPANPKERLLPFDADTWPRSRAWAMLGVAALITAAAAWSAPNIVFEENFREVAQIDWPWLPEVDEDAALEHAEVQGWRMAVIRFRHARAIRAELEPDTFVMDREQLDVGKKYSTAVGTLQTSTPTIVLFDDGDNAARTYDALRTAMETEQVDTIKGVASIWAFIPPPEKQQERLKEIHAIRDMIERENIKRFTAEQQKQIEELRPKLNVEAFGIHELPSWTKRLFREAGPEAKPPADGEEFAFEYTVYVNESVDSMVGSDARRFLNDIVAIGGDVGLDLRVASPSVVYVAMLDNIKTDGARMMGIALVLVFVMLSIGFRRPDRAIFALLPLAFGTVWMVGLAAFLGIKLDFFNVIILPVVIGIGVDDGVHFFYHWRETHSVGHTLKRVGSSVSMTSVTSMIGFGGLAITDYAGLASIGHLAICGIATTWGATLLIMPAVLRLRQDDVSEPPQHQDGET